MGKKGKHMITIREGMKNIFEVMENQKKFGMHYKEYGVNAILTLFRGEIQKIHRETYGNNPYDNAIDDILNILK